MNAKTGKMIFQRAPHKRMYPASTTKIALLDYVLSTPNLDLDQKIVVPQEAVRIVSGYEKSRENFSKYAAYVLEHEGTSAGLRNGEIILLRDALYGAMLVSGNDASNVLAYYWGNGSIEAGVEKVNRFVESLGCQNTRFQNPHGLPHPDHVSTAYDLATIARHALKNQSFRQIVASKTYTKGKTNKQAEVVFRQSNKLLVPGPFFCEQATGIKTGHHMRAGHCLVASGEDGDRSLIVVLLHCTDRKKMFLTAKHMLTRFLSEQKKKSIVIEKGPILLQKEIDGQATPLSLETPRECAVLYYPSEEPSIRAVAEWKDLSFPIKEGEEIGVLRVFVDDQEYDAVPLLASEHREASWQQRILHAQRLLKEHRGKVFTVLAAVVALVITLIMKRKARTYRR
jgi:D-alanyl-D-alanine carboxypeptidase (penicillin-binding protein 5/6)